MRKRQKEAILILFLREKEKYKKLAEHIIHLFWDDPSSPKESLHTITYRIKDKERLIKKIDEENKQLGADAPYAKKLFRITSCSIIKRTSKTRRIHAGNCNLEVDTCIS